MVLLEILSKTDYQTRITLESKLISLHLCTGMNTEIFKWSNLWRLPSVRLGPVHREHVIRENFAKCQLVDGRLWLHVGQICLSHLQPGAVQLRHHGRDSRLTSEQ